MSIELPPIPAIPSADAPAAEWARYLDILRMHVTADSAEAVREQTAQMVLMTDATVRNGDLMQQMLNMPPASGDGFSESFVRWLVQTLMRLPPEAP